MGFLDYSAATYTMLAFGTKFIEIYKGVRFYITAMSANNRTR
jgi:hypothetical protein